MGSLENVKQYLSNVGKAVLGRTENFESGPVNTAQNMGGAAVVMSSIMMIFFLILAFLCSYGAAKLSWCYNKFNGADNSTCFGWSILAFLFSGLYYPVYGVFLNPLCSLTKTGGRR